MSDSSYSHAFNEIRRRLHAGKAVLMVGAGFSRNAIPRTSGGRQFPLWPELTASIADRLYPEEGERRRILERSGATSAALRLAEEFQTAFSRPALIELVRSVIRDDDFLPGPLFDSLLELPWADVLYHQL
jgi:hypothetical protein